MCLRNLLLIAFLVPVAAFAEQNLLKNPNFQNGLEDWKTSISRDAKVTFAIAPDAGVDGSKCLVVTNQSARKPHVYGRLYQTIPVKPNTRYRMGFRVKAEKATGILFGGGAKWQIRRGGPSGTYDWKDVSYVYTTGPDEKTFTFHIIFENLADKIWVDNIFFDDLSVLDAASSMTLKTMPISELGRTNFYPARKLLKPTIDADFTEWQQDDFVTIPTKSATDLSTRTALAYDDENFYLAIEIKDDKHVAFNDQDMWEGDSVQFAFAQAGAYGPEYGITVVDDKTALWCWKEGTRTLKNDALTAKHRVNNGTIRYEIALPWKAIFATGKPEQALKFCLLTNDNDGQGREAWINWTPGIAHGKDPFNFVNVLLTNNKPGVFISTKTRKCLLNSSVDYTVYAANPTTNQLQDKLELAFIQKDIAVPADSVAIINYKWKLNQKGINTERVKFGGTQAECQVNVTDYSEENLEEQIQKIADGLPKLNELLEKCRTLKHPTDYQTVDVYTIRKFIPYVREDIKRRYYSRAHWAIGEMQQISQRAQQELQDILSGKLIPPEVPRYVTSKITSDGLTFSAKTVTPSDPTPRERPLFLTGYGHFSTAKRDIPLFSGFGANIIQFEMGPKSVIKPPRNDNEDFFVDKSACREIVDILKKAEKNNVAVCLLTSPHYFPKWALEKYPELNNYKGGFLRYTIDHPMAKKIIKAYLETLIPMVKDSPALHSICISNEPVYKDSSKDKCTKELWSKYLLKKHKTIGALNQLYKTDYPTFDAVPIPRFDLADQTPAYYDWCRFNDERFAAWHQWMVDIIHGIKPDLPCHAKIMGHPFTPNEGISAEQFAELSAYNGCDASWYYEYAPTTLKLNKMMWYEILTSMQHQPVINTEDHIIPDRDSRYIPEQAEHIATDMWMGAVCGRGGSIIWVWERVYDRYHALSDSILNRPDCVATVGRTALDLNRNIKDIKQLQNTPRTVAIVYSATAITHDQNYEESTKSIYNKLVLSGIAPAFITENQIKAGKLSKYSTVILPKTDYLDRYAAQKLADFAKTSTLIFPGKAPTLDEYAQPLTCKLTNTKDSLASITNPHGITTNFTDAQRIWWRSAKDGNQLIIVAVNLNEKPFPAEFTHNGKTAKRKLLPRKPVLLKIGNL